MTALVVVLSISILVACLSALSSERRNRVDFREVNRRTNALNTMRNWTVNTWED